MQLSRLYANKSFKTIVFNFNSLNVIIGKIFNVQVEGKDTHNLGKTILIEVIDFMLLKGVQNKDKFFLTKGRFIGYEFFCEILLNNGKYLLLKRSVDLPSKISFKLRDERLKANLFDSDWDYENIAFQEARNILHAYLAFDVLPSVSYRKTINYFLRHQSDYTDVFKLSKFKGLDKDWKPYLYQLMGYNSIEIEKKYDAEERKNALELRVKVLEGEASISASEKDKIEGLLSIKRDEIERNKQSIDSFNFQSKELELNNELVENIDAQIQELNTVQYRLSTEISILRRSLEAEPMLVDLEKIKELYNEINIYFPNQVIVEYEKLLLFNKQVFLERKGILEENLISLQSELNEVSNSLGQLHNTKKQSLEMLTERSTFNNFKKWQIDLSKLQSEVLYLEDKLKLVDEATKYYNQISDLEKEINDSVRTVFSQLKLQKHKELRKIFNSIINDVLNTNALLSMKVNKEGNIEFDATIQRPEDQSITEQDYGTSYKKLLCMAFDLSLLIEYSTKSYFKFSYHDGALEALDNRKKLAFIKKTREVCTTYNLQHIITLIDSDLPRNINGVTLDFNKDEYILELNDKDDSGRLFEFSF